jgi:thioredoxin 1
MSELTLTEANFEETIKNHPFVVVDLWAEWCGPCKMIAPILEELAVKHADKMVLAKINVDEQPGLAQKFDVTGIPTLLFFKNGVLLSERSVGAFPRPVLENKIISLF